MKSVKSFIYYTTKFFIIVPILVVAMIFFIQCEKQQMCTMINKCIILTLEYPDGQPVLLDSGRVLQVSNNQIISSWNGVCITGDCLIVDDSMQEELKNKKELMRFTGYLNGEIVCERDVLVGADRCHVKYLGKEPLTQVIYGVSDEVRDRKFCELVNVENIRWIYISYAAFRRSIDQSLPYEDKLQLIVDWLLSHSCITDAYIYRMDQIAFSFIENGEIVTMIMQFNRDEMYFGGFVSE
jgi:hypothetical protein